jgi:hypothetical protein
MKTYEKTCNPNCVCLTCNQSACCRFCVQCSKDKDYVIDCNEHKKKGG